ncbi:hypothetical protein CR513_33115, partial [Mucuna pruriens]
MLDKFKDLFQEMPKGLPPLRGIKHQIDFVLVILVPKKDGTWCMCMDYHPINSIMISYRHPIPCLDALLDELHGACVFSKIDLQSGYYQICMKEGDK